MREIKTKSLRIIGGEHRGRKIAFKVSAKLRPSLNHVREMVFNWLQWDIAGAKVLDLFAGSGAFGLEALSRGASYASFVECERDSAQLLQENIELIGYKHASQIYSRAFSKHWALPEADFDLVFLDPPYQSSLLKDSCEWLVRGGYLNAGAQIYIEAPRSMDLSFIPGHWERLKFKMLKRSVHGIWVAGGED